MIQLEFNFRNCKKSDFTKNSFVPDEDMTRMFCPDINDNLKDLYRLKNNYYTYSNQISFSVEVLVCDPDGEECEEKDKIR